MSEKRATWRDVAAARRAGFCDGVVAALLVLRAAGEDTYANEIAIACGRETLARRCVQDGNREMARYIRRVR